MNIGPLKILNSKEIKNIKKMLEQQFGYEEELDYVFLQNNKEKVYITTRELEKILDQKLRIDSIGLYFGKFYKDGFRLSIEGTQLIANKCKKNIVTLNQEQRNQWLKGQDIYVEKEDCFAIIKYEDDYLGSAKIKQNLILNSVSKARQLININEIETNTIDL